MRKLAIYIFLSIVFSTLSLNAQKGVILALEKNAIEISPNTECYNITIENLDDSAIVVGDQNYRLFFNGRNHQINKELCQSLLGENYDDLRLVQAMDGVDASGLGDLKYEDKLGFLNLVITKRVYNFDGNHVKKNDKINTIRLCFNKIDINNKQNIEILFGRNPLTSKYAQAYNVMNQVIGKDKLGSVTISGYNDVLEDR